MENVFCEDILKYSSKEPYQVVKGYLNIVDVNFQTNTLISSVDYDIVIFDKYAGHIYCSMCISRIELMNVCVLNQTTNTYIPLEYELVRNDQKSELVSAYFPTTTINSFNSSNNNNSTSILIGEVDDEELSNTILPISTLKSVDNVQRELIGDIKIFISKDHAQKSSTSKLTIHLKFDFSYKFEDEKFDADDANFYEKVFVTPHSQNFPSGGSNFCEWFPCFNKSFHSCPWTITVGCMDEANNNSVIVSGVLHQKTENTTECVYQIDNCIRPGNIGIVIGEVKEAHYEPYERIQAYCPVNFEMLLKQSLFEMTNFINYYEVALELKYPFEKLKVVFTNVTSKIPSVFYGLIVLNTCHLCPVNVPNQVYNNYKLFSMVLAECFFGCYFTPRFLTDVWILVGSVFDVVETHLNIYLGMSEAKMFLLDSSQYLTNQGDDSVAANKDKEFMLCPLVEYINEMRNSTMFRSKIKKDLYEIYAQWLRTSHPNNISSKNAWKTYCSRAWFVIRYLVAHQIKNTFKIFFKQKLTQNSKDQRNNNNLILDSDEFLQFFTSVKGVDAKETYYVGTELLKRTKLLSLCMVNQYNKKKHSVEFFIASNDDNTRVDVKTLPATLKVYIKEIRNEDIHSVEVESFSGTTTLLPGKICLRAESNCRGNKFRRSYKRRFIQNDNNLLLPMDVNESTQKQHPHADYTLDDCVLFAMPDPTFCEVYGHIRMIQSEFSWHQQLEHSRNPLYQVIAIRELAHFASADTLRSLASVIKIRRCYYGARKECFNSIIQILNDFISQERSTWLRQYYPAEMYKAAFGLKSDHDLSHPTIFHNIPEYLLQLAMIKAMRKLHPPKGPSSHVECLLNTKNLLYRLWKSKTNISNVLSDCCYRSEILKSLGRLLLTLKSNGITVTKYVELLLNESIDTLNEEVVKPSYHYCLTRAAIKCIYMVNQCEPINNHNDLFVKYSQQGINDHIRCAAIKCLVQSLHCVNDQTFDIINTLVNIILYDRSMLIRETVVCYLLKYPPVKCVEPNNYFKQNYLLSRFNQIFYHHYFQKGGLGLNRVSWDSFQRVYRTLFGDAAAVGIKRPPSNVVVLPKTLVEQSILSHEARKSAENSSVELTSLPSVPVVVDKPTPDAKVVKTIDDGQKIKIVFKLKQSDS